MRVGLWRSTHPQPRARTWDRERKNLRCERAQKTGPARDETVGAYLASKLIVIVTLASIGWPLSIAGWYRHLRTASFAARTR